MANIITPIQQTVLNTLHFAATHHGVPVRLKKQYHAAAGALIRRGLVEKVDADADWPSYRLSVAGMAYMQEWANDAQ